MKTLWENPTLSRAASSRCRAAACDLADLKNARVEGERGSAESSMEDRGDRAPRLVDESPTSFAEVAKPLL